VVPSAGRIAPRITIGEGTMCKVLNARGVGKHPAPDRVYVGRPSKWSNPFVIGRDGSRDEVIAKYAHGLGGSHGAHARRLSRSVAA